MIIRPDTAGRQFPPNSPLYWECPTCESQPDQRCTTRRGRQVYPHQPRWDAVTLWERYGRGHQECTDPAAHAAHLQLNGECPWCGGTTPLPATGPRVRGEI
jgi:hypothetical protein